jgi:rfaE bifunctional protein kinase chain/domain
VKNQRIRKIFDSFHKLKVLIIGDVMIDAYIWGEVERISPEAPVPVLSAVTKENRLGGAANVGINIQALDAEPIICSVIGDTNYKGVFETLLKRKRMSDEGIIKDTNRPTTVKTRIISNNQQLIRIDEEDSKPISQEIESQMIEKIRYLMEHKEINAVIFEDYDKGVITPGIIKTCVEEANKSDIPVLVDPKERNFFNYQNVTLFKPNYKEFIKGNNRRVPKNDFDQLYELAKEFKQKLNIKYILVTLAELGLIFCDNKQYKHIPALEQLDVADVSGAGDTVIATLATCIAAGIDIEDASVIANVAGGLVCEKAGVVSVDKKQLLNEMRKGNYL